MQSAVNTWIFDLDDTLYPCSSSISKQIRTRIVQWIGEHYGFDEAQARERQKYFIRTYGTSLRGLIHERNIDPYTFMDFVHELDLSELKPNEDLKRALLNLPGSKFILTNASRRHAENIMRCLGIEGIFNGIFDVSAANFEPKPLAGAYHRFLDLFAIEPDAAIIFEDVHGNLKVPHELGLRTVLVTPEEIEPEKLPYVDFITGDLVSFLKIMPQELRANAAFS